MIFRHNHNTTTTMNTYIRCSGNLHKLHTKSVVEYGSKFGAAKMGVDHYCKSIFSLLLFECSNGGIIDHNIMIDHR